MNRWLSFVGCCLLVGCSGGGLTEVSGTVLIDDAPLKEGEIIFEEIDGSKTPAGGPIADGKYTVKVLPGSKKVLIKASRPTSKPDPVMGSAAKEARVGPEYNEKTTLTADINASGRQEGVDFKVKEAPKKK